MFPPNGEAMMTDVDDAVRVVSINSRCSTRAFRSCCRARLRSVAIRLAFCSPPLGQDENASSMGQCKEGRGAAHQINPSYSSSRCCTPGSRAPSAYRVGRSANGCCCGYELVTQLSCAARGFLLLLCRRCCSSDSRSVPSDGVVANECMEAAEKSGGVVGDQIIIGRGEGLFYHLAVESLVNLRQFDGACQFAGACSGASGTGEYPAAGLERLGNRDANPIYRHCDFPTSPQRSENKGIITRTMSKKGQMHVRGEYRQLCLFSAVRGQGIYTTTTTMPRRGTTQKSS